MKNLKRILALALALCMLCSVVPMSAFAAATVGHMATKPADGTSVGAPFPENTGGSYSFRIPAMVTLSDGTLVAAADARWNTTYDGGGLDTVVARSEDGGANWSYTFANYLGDNGNAYNGASSCFIDPSLAVYNKDGQETIYMLCDLYPNGVALNGSKQCMPDYTTGFTAAGDLKLTTKAPATNYNNYVDGDFTHYLKNGKIYANDGTEVAGYTVDSKFNVFNNGNYVSNLFFADSPYHVARTGYLYLTKSTDGGKSWSDPTLLNLKRNTEMVCLVGPNGGMVTKSGVIVFPVYSYTGSTEYTGLIYSTDGGSTWTRSADFTEIRGSEADAVELGNGKLRVFFRNQTTNLCYADYDLNTNSWGRLVNTLVYTNSNTELSVITYSKSVIHEGKEKTVILVSCPASANLAGSSSSDGSWRTSGRIFAGLVDPDTYQMTWLDKSVQVTPVATSQLSGSNYTAAQGFFAYSSLAETDSGSVAILYENNQYGWGAGNGYGYTMAYETYTESELETALGVTFSENENTDPDEDPDDPDDDAVPVTLKVGETKTFTDNTGNYKDSYKDEGLNKAVATVVVDGVAGTDETTVSTTKATAVEAGATYIIRVYNTNYALTSNQGRQTWGDSDGAPRAFESFNNAEADNMWTLEASGDGYKLKCAAGYLNLGKNAAWITESGGDVFTFTSSDAGWAIGDGTYNIDALGGLTNYYCAGGWPNSGTRFDLYKVTTATAASTTINITGVSIGKTSVTVGNTKYNISVLPDINKTVDIALTVGGTYWYVDDSGVFTSVAIAPDGNIATAKIADQLVPVTELEHDKDYLIVNKKTGDVLTDTAISVSGQWGNKPGLETTGKASAESTELWNVKKYNDQYTIAQNGKYLAVAGYETHLYDAFTSLVLTYTPNGWTICDKQTGPNLNHGPEPNYLSDYVGDNYSGGALGTSDTSNEYIYWDIYEVHPGSTVVEFTGVSKGKTEAIIGNTQYNITVSNDYEEVDIELEIGESFTFTDTTGNHANQVVQGPDDTKAIMNVQGTVNATQKKLVPVTATTFTGGHRYVIENVRAKTAQSDHSVLTSAETADKGLVMDGPLNVGTSQKWNITPSDNMYLIGRDGEYINIVGQNTTMEAAAQELTMQYVENKGWLIYIDGTTDYYLSDLSGANSNNAYGWYDAADEGNYWNIYEVVDDTTAEATHVIFTGVAEGKTYAIVGSTQYNITVVPLEVDDEVMNSATGIWTVDPEIQNQRYNALIGLEKDLFTDESWREYEAARREAYKKLVEVINAKYDSAEKAAEALQELTDLVDALEEAKDKLVAAKTISIHYTLDGTAIDIREYKVAATETALSLPDTIVVDDIAYRVTTPELTLGVDTTIYVPVETIGALGGGFVASADITATAHNGHGQVADLVDDAGVAKKITEMTLTVGTSYDLNLATDTTGKTVEWSVMDDTVATVDQNGNVAAVGVGTTHVTATIKDADGNIVEANTIPVTVFPKGTGERETAIYIDHVNNTTVWCVVNADTANYGFQVVEGELIYGKFDTTVGDGTKTTAMSFFGDPDEAHALVYMKSTGSDDHYFLLHDDKGDVYDGTAQGANDKYYVSGVTSGAGWWQAVGLGNNKTNHNDANWEAIKDMVQWAVVLGCDGGLGFTRRQDENALASNLSFSSDPMPRIEKTIDGVLPTSRKQADYQRYTENMVAAVDELVYFKITVSQEMPANWKDTAQTESEIKYSNAWVTDTILPGAYLYTKELDQADGSWDGEIAPDFRVQVDEITDELNKPWTEEEKAAGKRAFEYYLVYQIQESDIPKFWINNIAELSYQYETKYSKGAQAGAADAEAKISVVGSAIDNVVIDFGQTVTYTGLTNAHLKGVYVDGVNDDPNITQSKAFAKYGDVSVTRTPQLDENGEIKTDNKGYPLYDYAVSYTPHSILHETDMVILYGIGENNQEKIINGFLVYPATTVYYEEGFMLNEDSTWDATKAAMATGEQTFELLGKSQFDQHGMFTHKISDKKHPYGYDPLYTENGYTYGNSYAESTKMGQTTTFTFTGTGFDLYANCTKQTGYVAVQVKNSAGKFVKLYTVDTIVKGGSTVATQQHEFAEYHLPIVSVDLGTHDTYTVTVNKIMDTEPVRLDGIRIHNTLADSSVYNIDLEDNPELYQLRDYVLTAVDVNKTASEDYGKDWLNRENDLIGPLAEQVYGTISNDSEAPLAVVTSTGATTTDVIKEIYGEGATVQDLLDNGPKNELFLYPRQTLTFKVKTSRAMQIGLKAPSDATDYMVTYTPEGGTKTEKSGTLGTSVDMFYALENPINTETTYTVSVTNTGNTHILSVTDLKICDDPNAAFVPLTVGDIEQILKDTYFGADEEVEPDGLLGDLDLNGKVNSDDLTLLARHVGGIELAAGQALLNADVNGDGKVNSDDLTKHARYVGGIITNWDQD